MRKAFLKVRFTEQLRLAKKLPGNRDEIIRVLLESAKVGLEDDAKPLLEKLL